MNPSDSFYSEPWITDTGGQKFCASRSAGVWFGVEGWTLTHNGRCFELGMSGLLREKDSQFLEEQGAIINQSSPLFLRKDLCRSVFGWNRKPEWDFLASQTVAYQLGNSPSAIDLGCGWGEILDHAADHGIECSGVDLNPVSTKRLRAAGYRVFQASISEFIDCQAHDAAYATMNTLRYLGSSAELTKCLKYVGEMIRPSGKFIFQLTIDHEDDWYKNGWNCILDDKNIHVLWEKEFQSKSYIVDRVRLRVGDEIYHQERQNQLFASEGLISDVLHEVAHIWRLECVYRGNFKALGSSIPERGTHWFVLHRL